MNERKNKIYTAISAILFTIGFDYYLYSYNNFVVRSIMNLIICFFTYNMLRNNKVKADKNIIIFSGVLSLILFIGKGIYITNQIDELLNIKAILINLLSIYSFTIVISKIIAVIVNFLKEKENEKKEKKQWAFFAKKHIAIYIYIIIFLSWIPTYLAYYPGIFSYDMADQLNQSIGDGFYNINKHHPPIHTIIIKTFFTIGRCIGVNGIIIYSIIQMLLLSLAISEMINYMIEKKCDNWIILVSLLFVTINPIISIFSMIPTKDVYFAAFLILFIIELMKIVDNSSEYINKNKNYLYFATITLLVCLFRNNAIYVIIILTPIFCIKLKKYWKKILLLFIIPIFTYIIVNNYVYNLLGIQAGDSKEFLSVPMQQIAFSVVKNSDSISEETKEKINHFMPYDKIEELYNPRFADNIKDVFKEEYLKNNKKEFFELWYEMLLQYPKEYISAFLSLNIPYWYPDANSVDSYSKRIYIETNIRFLYDTKRDSKIPILLDFYERIANYEIIDNIPFISMLFSISFPIWILLFSAMVLLEKGLKNELLVLYPLILLWLTYMLGPVSNLRYIFPIFVTYPILLAMMFNSSKLFIKNKTGDF